MSVRDEVRAMANRRGLEKTRGVTRGGSYADDELCGGLTAEEIQAEKDRKEQARKTREIQKGFDAETKRREAEAKALKDAKEAKAEAEAIALKESKERARIARETKLAEDTAEAERIWEIEQLNSPLDSIRARAQMRKAERERKEKENDERYEEANRIQKEIADRKYAPLPPSELEKQRARDLKYKNEHYMDYIRNLYDGEVFAFEPTSADLRAVADYKERFERRSEEPKAIMTPLERERRRDMDRATIEALLAVESELTSEDIRFIIKTLSRAKK